MSKRTSNTVAIVLWSAVLILSVTLLTMLSLQSVARAPSRNQTKSGKSVITLSTRNTLSIRSEVTASGMTKLSSQLLAMSRRLPADAVIYLVLDTPGGDVNAGNSFLDLADAIPQRIDTITMLSASMGFHIAQHLGNRYVTPSGRFMSHRIRIGGLSGQVPGEAVTRLSDIMALAYRMDLACAKRMGIDLEKYRNLIRDEYWVSGEAAVTESVADKVVLATCDSSFDGFIETEVPTMFGVVKVRSHKCPLISGSL